ncbi:MAG: hypothetical protein ABI400_13050 [Lacisediminihabitans sp.]
MWGLFSAIAAGLLAIAGQIASAERHPRAFKQLAALVEMWQKMPKGSDAEITMARIVNQRANSIESRLPTRPPLNPTNVALTILLSGGLG